MSMSRLYDADFTKQLNIHTYVIYYYIILADEAVIR